MVSRISAEGESCFHQSTVGTVLLELGLAGLFPNWLNVPLVLEAVDHGDRTEYVATVLRTLDSKSLYDFLRATTNNRFDPGVVDVRSDWEMPDRAHGRPGSGVEYFRRLLHLHEAMGTSWLAFETVRREFITAIEPPLETQIRTTLPCPFLIEPQIAADLKSKLYRHGKATNQLFAELLRETTRANLQVILANSRVQHELLPHERKMDTTELQRQILGRIRHSQWYSQRFFDSELWSELLRRYREQFFEATEVKLLTGEKVTAYQMRAQDSSNFNLRLHQNGRWYDLVLEHDRLLYRTNQDGATVSLVPSIHWTKVESSAARHTRELHVSSLLGKSAETVAGMSINRNSLMGILLVALFSPEERQLWPTKMGLPGGNYEQAIGPGQAPVMAHLRATQLSESAVLPAMEALLSQEG